MHRITFSQMNAELRPIGALMRTFIPYFRPSTFRMANRFMRHAKGRLPKDMDAQQVYLRQETGRSLRLLVCSPPRTLQSRPGLLWMHGGGYGLGIPEQDMGFIRPFVHEANCTVVAPDYTLSVVAPYPAALEDCMKALLWMKDNARELGIREDQLFVGGDSAGGGLAAAVAIRARDEGSVRIAYQIPLYPMIDDRMMTASAQNNDAPNWNTKSNENGWRLYLGDLYGSDQVPDTAAPARLEDFRGLPPACTYVGTLDPFLDETKEYVRCLQQAGVPVSFRIFEGCFHGFDIVAPRSRVAQEARSFLMECLRNAIEHCFATQEAGSSMNE